MGLIDRFISIVSYSWKAALRYMQIASLPNKIKLKRLAWDSLNGAHGRRRPVAVVGGSLTPAGRVQWTVLLL
jgi:hypothetical protein